ncbi:MAG: hypothetical protein R2725_13880 [Solirubrobacterales bacterium]
MIRRLAAIALVLVAALAVYLLLVRDKTVTATVHVSRPAATLTSGEETVVISTEGREIPWYPLGERTDLPALPEAELPAGGRLSGPMLEQARVLGAAPRPLRPYVERSRYGERGVEVVLDAGPVLRFGDATQAKRKWRAAAAVIASDPTAIEDGYVDLLAPSRAAKGG